ncbi:peptidase C39 family protein [Candidatus Woesearchaeota archaeon]|nr:peptidase C39 family protein [Candidatus Woesearchaeota archaeon]
MKYYKQTTEYTCAASSLLMVLHKLNSDYELSEEHELEIWASSANLPTRASSIYGLALYSKQKGFFPKIIVSSKSFDYPDYRFKGYKKIEIETAEKLSKIFYTKAINQGIEIEEKQIDSKTIINLLKQNKLLIARLNAGVFRKSASNSQYVVLYGLQENSIKIMDPLTGLHEISYEDLEVCLDTLHSKKKRDSKIIIFDQN